MAAATVSHGDVLPDDRADILYHSYDGGGVEVEGPSVLIRKKFGDSFSATYNYYVDMISSASIDVVTQASPYKERRTQQSFSGEFLQGKTTYNGGYITSSEPDYLAKTGFFSVSEDMFGDLTNISFGFTRGWDKVGDHDHQTGITTWVGDDDRRNWQVGLSQVLTRNLLLGLNLEVSDSVGYLHNPYRSVRYLDPSVPRGYSYAPEIYPNTRTGGAGSVQLKYYLPWRAALEGSYRYYSDTWGIDADTTRLGYTQPLPRNFTVGASVRYYWQTHASFYSDLFPYANSQNYMARDRELAQFRSTTLGLTGSWEYHPTRWTWINKATLNFSWDRLHIGYQDFRDVLDTAAAPGAEPLYALDANVFQFFISVWY